MNVRTSLRVFRPPTGRRGSSPGTLLAVLSALNVLNYVDRQLLAGVAPLVAGELGLDHARMGLLLGFAFVCLFAVSGLFMGVFADRLPRPRLLAFGLALWSGMTAASGLARGFGELLAARVLVGVGEATLAPAAVSMLGDRFPPSRAGLAMGVYYSAIPLGTALSFLVAGWAGARFGWRACFMALGLLGLLGAFAVAALKDPPRRGALSDAPKPSLAELGTALRAALARPALGLAILGAVGLAYAGAATIHEVSWLVKERGFSAERAAVTAGLVALGGGLLGNLGGGALADACARRFAGGRLLSLVLVRLAATPLAAAAYLLPPSSALFLPCWLLATASSMGWYGPVLAAIQELAPAAARATTVAAALVAVYLLGVGPGAFLTGLLGDRHSLTLGLLASVGVGLLAVLPVALAAREGRPSPIR